MKQELTAPWAVGRDHQHRDIGIGFPGLAATVPAGIFILAAASAMGQIHFSHDHGTIGLPPAPPSAVFAAPHVQDVFTSPAALASMGFVPAGNFLTVDNPAGLGLLPGDNIDAIDGDGATPLGTGVVDLSFVFSVRSGATGAPGTDVSLEAPFNAADLFGLNSGGPGHGLLNHEIELSLSPNNVIESVDGLSLDPLNVFAAGQRIRFSLAPGSPTLLVNGWSAADVLTAVVGVPASLRRSISAGEIGLLPTDDVDGLVLFSVHDADGDGVLTDLGDYGVVCFSVRNGSSGMAASAVRRESVGNGAGGDIFASALGGTNALVADNVNWNELDPGDDLDALDEYHRYFGSPPLVTGGPLPNPPPIQNPPPYIPPMYGMGGFKLGFCDQSTGGGSACLAITVKLCDPNGNRVERSTGEQYLKGGVNLPGGTGANAMGKANFFATTLAGMTVNKSPGPPVRIFGGVAAVPGGGALPDGTPAFPSPPIQAVVCATQNPALAACGWTIDAVCFSGNLITHGLKPLMYTVTPAGAVCVRFDCFTVPSVPTSPGSLGMTFSDFLGADASLLTYQTPFAAGEQPAAILGRIRDQILADGGSAVVAGNKLAVAAVAVEPPNGSELTGPSLVEWGANDNLMIVQTEAAMRTERAVLGDNNPDGDNLIGLADWNYMLGCLSGPGIVPVPQSCYVMDTDGSLNVDLLDVALFQNRFAPGPGPFNDDCFAAVDVSEGVTPFTNIGAQTDGPALTSQCGTTGPANIFYNDVWFNYVASCSGPVTIDTCESDYDALLAVYDSFECPVSNAALQACDDDGCGQIASGSTVTISATAGQSYKLRIGGFNGASGGGVLNITCNTTPDVCGPPNPQSCFVANPGPGCNDAGCCGLVCAVDPFCCATAWDGICAMEALDICGGGDS